MAGETIVTIVGNLTRDPELRTLNNGSTVANFTIASSERRFNRDTNQWEDGDYTHLRRRTYTMGPPTRKTGLWRVSIHITPLANEEPS